MNLRIAFFRARTAFAVALACAHPAVVTADDAVAASNRLTLDDLYGAPSLPDAAVSPSGSYLAAIVRQPDVDILLVKDLKTQQQTGIAKIGHGDLGKRLRAGIVTVYWKTDERLLFRVKSEVASDSKQLRLSDNDVLRLGQRLIAVNRDGTNTVQLLSNNGNASLAGALDLGSIASFLPKDPGHVLMVTRGWDGLSLFKVDLQSGRGDQVQPASPNVTGWWLDVDGNAVIRKESSLGSVRFYRKEASGKWKKFFSYRTRERKERVDYEPVGPSDQSHRYYVLARPPGRDRYGLYLYDLESEEFGEPVIENPNYDLVSAQISRDGKRVLRHCYVADVRVCEFSDARLDAHMRAVRKFFNESANVIVWDASEDGNSILFFVEGPNQAPAFYYYLVSDKRIQAVGNVYGSMAGKALPSASVVSWQSRDGRVLTGYLTRPPGAEKGAQLPLVVMPHGGPEVRDQLTFDNWVQFIAARGYAVFQPNFRGSDGFGRAFAESGYGEWGRKMQDDITDGLKSLIDRGVVDPTRVCIVGASYGGYAALIGATLTPEVYRCAVSIAGVSDLVEFTKWRRKQWGGDSEGYAYSLKTIGNPETDAARMVEVSPARLAGKASVPVLLVHGDADDIVPIEQSERMKKALDKAGHPTELISFEGEGHPVFSDEHERLMLGAIDRFLWQRLGAGFGVTTPPVPPPKH